MSLLPKNVGQFAQESYWNDFFKARGDKAFDWYGEYPQLSGVLHKYIKPNDKILMVGCGNSTLSETLYDLSYHDIESIDISESAIRMMSRKNEKKRPKMKYIKMDATKLEYEDGHFKSAIDKGTLDALLPNMQHKEVAVSMLTDVWRVVKLMGTYMIISLAQDHVLHTLVDAFKDRPCIFRAHKLHQDTDEDGDAFFMPVFAFVVTKLKDIAGLTTIWETVLQDDKTVRHKSIDEFMLAIKECQYFSTLRHKLSKGSLLEEGFQPFITFYAPDQPEIPRYTVWVVDSHTTTVNRFAVFIVPQGKESDEAFATKEGRANLVASVGYQRLLVIHMSRGHVYKDVEEVKAELSQKVMEFAPAGTQERFVPFLSMPDGIGKRDIVYQTKSSVHGDIFVEDIATDRNTVVRQTFLGASTDPICTARVIIKRSQGRKKGAQKVTKTLVKAELCSQVEKVISSVVCHCGMSNTSLPNLLVLGLKCGTLPTFLANYMAGTAIKDIYCLEEDEALADVAKQCYSLHKDITILTGAKYDQLLSRSADKDYGCIVFDDVSLDLMDAALALISKTGLFVVSTHPDKSSQVKNQLEKTFAKCQHINIGSKSVIFGCNRSLRPTSAEFQQVADLVKGKLKADSKMSDSADDNWDCSDALSSLSVSGANDS